MIYLAPLTVAPGRATREVGSLIWGSDTSGRTKLDVLIFEIYGIAGVINILLDVTFLCVVMWIYIRTRMYWRIVT